MHAPDELPSAPSPAAILLAALASLALGLHVIGVGAGPAASELDPSWTAVLGWAYAEGAAFGTSIVFTYGPLGFLHPGAAYVPEAYPAFLAGQLAVGALMALCTTRLLLALPLGGRLAWLALLVVLAPWVATDVAWLLYLAQLPLAACLPALAPAPAFAPRPAGAARLMGDALLGLGAAVIALVKFSLLPLAGVAIACTAGALWLEGRRRAACALGLGFVGGLAGLWWATGQALADAPAYLATSLEIARGYTLAMGLMPGTGTDALGFATMALSGGWLAWMIVLERARPARGLLLFTLGCVVFFAWRAGFTRADAHIHGTFPLVAAAPLLALALVAPERRVARAIGMAAAAAALLSGLWLARAEVQPARWGDALDRLPAMVRALASREALVHQRETIAAQRRAALPLDAIRAHVGDAGVDVLGWQQGLPILHGMTYRPRPVFQSYSAYTGRLQRLNEAHFLGPEAPRFVLVAMEAIDGRLAGTEDGLALLAVLRGWTPVLEESGLVLFERRPAVALSALPSPPLDQALRRDAWITLPDGTAPRRLAIAIEPSLLGRLHAFWFRHPPLAIEIEADDGSLHRFRLSPDAAREGLLIDPLLRGNDDLRAALDGQPTLRARRARVVVGDPADAWAWSEDLRVGIDEAGWTLPPPGALPRAMRDTVAAGFALEPVAREGLVNAVTERGAPAMFMHAPAAMTFAPAPGTYAVDLEVGLRDAAVGDPGCAGNDGLRWVLERVAADGAREPLALRDLDPLRREADRGPQPLAAEVTLGEGDALRLAVEAGPAGHHAACDWGWARRMRLQPATPGAVAQ